MGAEDDVGSGGDLVDLLDEDRALLLELGDDVDVVHDLLAHVDGGAVALQRLLDGDDGPIDAGAVAAGSGQQNPLVSDDRVILKPPGSRTYSWDAWDGEMYGSRSHPLILPASS